MFNSRGGFLPPDIISSRGVQSTGVSFVGSWQLGVADVADVGDVADVADVPPVAKSLQRRLPSRRGSGGRMTVRAELWKPGELFGFCFLNELFCCC